MDGSNQIRDIRGNIVRISIIKTYEEQTQFPPRHRAMNMNVHILKFWAWMPERGIIVKNLVNGNGMGLFQ